MLIIRIKLAILCNMSMFARLNECLRLKTEHLGYVCSNNLILQVDNLILQLYSIIRTTYLKLLHIIFSMSCKLSDTFSLEGKNNKIGNKENNYVIHSQHFIVKWFFIYSQRW